MKTCGTKREEEAGDIWPVQVITFVLGQGSLYKMEWNQYFGG
jgi:hypothetical protein